MNEQTATPDPHPLDEACFFCASDRELAATVPPFGVLSPQPSTSRRTGRVIHMTLPMEACPFMTEEGQHA